MSHNSIARSVAFGLSVMLLVTACSSQTTTDSAERAGSKTKTETVQDITQIPAELTFYNATVNEPYEEFMSKYGSLIAKKFPNYKINYIQAAKGSTLPELIAAGTANIDILIGSYGAIYDYLVKYNLHDDISDLVKKYNYDLNQLEPTTIEIQKQMANGGMYGLPFTIATTILYYNKDLFDKFAQPHPKDGMTWDELYALTQKLSRTDAGVSYRGLVSFPTFNLRLNQTSAPLLDVKSNKSIVSAELFKREFENLTRFYTIPGNGLPGTTMNTGEQVNLFNKDQTAAMMLHLTRAAVTVTGANPNLNWDMVQQPYWPNLKNVGPQVMPYYFYSTKVSKNRDAAFQVLAYATSEEYQRHIMRQGFMSSLKNPEKLLGDLGADLPVFKTKNLKAFLYEKYATPPQRHEYEVFVEAELLKAMAEVAVAGTDVNTALRNASERADKRIEEELQKAGK